MENHISDQIKTNIEKVELHRNKVAGAMLPIVENQVKGWERRYNKDVNHLKNGIKSLRSYVAYLETEVEKKNIEIAHLEGSYEEYYE